MERNRLNFAKHQLLRYVEELFVRLCDLASPNIEESMNMPSHGLERRELEAVLYQMFSDRLLVALTDARGFFSPTLAEIEDALNEQPDLHFKSDNTFYGMTTGANELFKELRALYGTSSETDRIRRIRLDR